MSRSTRFKDTQVFDWEQEPHDERPSEFVPSTGYSQLSGYYATPDAAPRRRRRRRGISALTASLVALGFGGAALLGFLHLLRG